MATTQEDLLKALRGSSGREQVNFDLGQVTLRPTIQQGGQYQVSVRDAPKTNSALQLASALQGGSQLLSNFVDLQSKQGEIEASVLTPLEVQQKVEQGDPNATNFLDKLGKEKAFTENVYKRYFTSTVQPKLQALQQELKSRPVHEYADMGITTPEDFQQYASGRVQELTDEFSQYTSKSPYAQALHNQLVETVVPDLVQKQVAMFDEGVTEFNKKEVITNRIPFNIENGVVLDPQANTQSGTQNVFREKPRGTIYGFEKKGDATFDTNSSFGIGANASAKEMAEIKAGKTNDAKLVANKDFALSPDLEEQARAAGFNLRDTMTMTMEDGSTHTGRWMDRTAKEFQGKTLSGRVDVYSPNGDSPVKDKVFVGFSRGAEDAMTSFENSVSQITNINIESYKNAKYSPSEASKIAREDIVAQVKSLSTEGRFQEARKLQGVLEKIKVGGQPLFGLADGKLQLVALEDAIDRDEEQEYAQNEKLSKQIVEKESANGLLDIMTASEEERDSLLEKLSADFTAREDLTPAIKVEILNTLRKQADNEKARAYTDMTRTEAAVVDVQDRGGSGRVFKELSTRVNDASWLQTWLERNPDKKDIGYVNDPLTQKQVINPVFQQAVQNALLNVEPVAHAKNTDITRKIMSGKAFSAIINGKSEDFPATTTKQEKDALHQRLGQLYIQEVNTEFDKFLKENLASDPLFAKAQAASKPANAYDAAFQKYVNKGIPKERAEKLATEKVLKGSTGILDSKGNVITNRGFRSHGEYVKDYRAAVKSGVIPPDQAETAHNAAIFNNKKVVSDLAQQFDSNPSKNMGAIDELEASFSEVGIPFEDVQKGYITYSQSEAIGTGIQYMGSRMVEKYWSIKEFLERPDTETKYRIIPVNVLRNKDNPEARKVIEKIAEKYNKTYASLVAGQESWYESRNIKISK